MAGAAVEKAVIDPALQGAYRADRVTITEYAPAPELREFVRSYHYTEMHLGSAGLLSPVTARPEQMLQFSLGTPFTVIHRESATRYESPDVVLVGRQTQRNFDLLAIGEVVTLTVHFQPAGLYRLFGVPMPHLTDRAADATDVLGPPVGAVRQRVGDSRGVEQMIAHIEALLRPRVDGCRPYHPVQPVAESFLSSSAPDDLGAAVRATGLSVRQFQRAFVQQVGVGPKLFRRIVRFAEALQLKSESPRRTWAEMAAHAGYFDQMHFTRDCRVFGGDTPSSLIQTWIDCRP